MRRALASLSLPLALLFIANVVPSFAQKPAAAEEEAEEVEVRVREGAPLELACALRVEQRPAWRREGGGALPPGLAPAGEEPRAAGGVTARLRAAAARAHHAGVYACAHGPGAARLRLVVEPAAPAAPAARATPAAPAPGEAAPAQEEADGPLGTLLYYELFRNTSMTCTLDNPNKLDYVWKKNGTLLEALAELQGRYRLEAGGARLVLPPRLREDDYGNYSCSLKGAGGAGGAGGAEDAGGAVQAWRLHARVYTKLPANTNVVEGQKLKLVCRVVGKPAPPVDWRYNNGSLPAGAALAASDAGVEGAVLELAAARRAHAGEYSCRPRGGRSALAPDALTVVRVKDMYAALWPFLGICAEVLVLCAIILVYEKRRTKPELDDSDTDNHDQKKS